jgi:hypothetical protein
MRYFQCREELRQFKEACPQWHVFPDPEAPGWIVVPHFLPSKNSRELTALRSELATVGINLRVAFNPQLKRWDILGAV